MKGYLKMFANCRITNGAGRSLIYDGQRKTYYLVPHSLVRFLEKADGRTFDEVESEYAEEDHSYLKEYLDFLLQNDLIFFCDTQEELNRFPPLDDHWDYPALITNAVLEVVSIVNIQQFNHARGSLFIPYLQLTITAPVTHIKDLEVLVDELMTKDLKGIQLHFDNKAAISESALIDLCNRKGIIETIVAFNSSYDKLITSDITHLYFTRQACFDKQQCGVINPEYFNTEWQHYTESLNHNTCLNRKLAVDAAGEIKNCPAMAHSYGNVQTIMLSDAIAAPGFQKPWAITKDQIAVCKDCEFRHLCTDCRAYTEVADDLYSKPLKCGYNPYTCEWETS